MLELLSKLADKIGQLNQDTYITLKGHLYNFKLDSRSFQILEGRAKYNSPDFAILKTAG